MKIKIIAVIFTAILVFVLSYGCFLKKEIKIGFLGGLTGKSASLGIAGRNGLNIAAEEINGKMGICGYTVRIIPEDNKSDTDTAREKLLSLVNKDKVMAVVGPMTSSIALGIVDMVNSNKIICISPTVSSYLLQGKDDYFFQVTTSNDREAMALAKYVKGKDGIKNISIIYDMNNEGYSKTYFESFKKEFLNDNSAAVITDFSFDSQNIASYRDFLQKVLRKNTEAILAIASDIDTAIICQNSRLIKPEIMLYGCGWSLTKQLLQNGGKSVEKMIFCSISDYDSTTDIYNKFREKYYQRYTEYPSFGSINGYEAGMLLFEAIKNANLDKSRIKENLLKISSFTGPFGEIKFNSNGDVVRPVFCVTVKDGSYKTAGRME